MAAKPVKPCPDCKGAGAKTRTCPICNGNKNVNGKKCGGCNGMGTVNQKCLTCRGNGTVS